MTPERENELIALAGQVFETVKPHLPMSDDDRIFFDAKMCELMKTVGEDTKETCEPSPEGTEPVA